MAELLPPTLVGKVVESGSVVITVQAPALKVTLSTALPVSFPPNITFESVVAPLSKDTAKVCSGNGSPLGVVAVLRSGPTILTSASRQPIWLEMRRKGLGPK